MNAPIPFNRPSLVGQELTYIARAVAAGNLGGEGAFSSACVALLEEKLGLGRVFLTPSCSVALDLAALLCELAPGDEVLLPSFTFVSTANAVTRLGARPVFVDIHPDTLNLDESRLAAAGSARTRAVIPVHYAGVGCRMGAVTELARQRGWRVIEDAAQGVNAATAGRSLGAWGDLAAFSFHETKNYHAGQGGALVVNDPALVPRAEVLHDKGTDRARFLRGEVAQYQWLEPGIAALPSELMAAFLLAQLEQMDELTTNRGGRWDRYLEALTPLAERGACQLPTVPADCRTNYHLFYLLAGDSTERQALLAHLRERGIHAVFHYVPLHLSPEGRRWGYGPSDLPVTESAAERLVRLPLFHSLTDAEQARVIDAVYEFYRGRPT